MKALNRFRSGGSVYDFADARTHIGPDVYERLPFAARILAENVTRHLGEPGFTTRELDLLADRRRVGGHDSVALRIPRVILPDSSGIPVLMDLAALRTAVARRGLAPESIDTAVPVDLVVDHSLQVEASGVAGADVTNLAKELKRNMERYRFLRWAQSAFRSLTVFPPGSGIIHQVNIEQVAKVVRVEETGGRRIALPDMVVGGDSHTPMVAALGVLGWGVGGIEAESVLLGQAYVLPVPEFVGVRLMGRLPSGITVTDLALAITARLRSEGVVGSFVEFFGPAIASMSVPDRATLSNMAPEYGATTGFWAVDAQTLDYLRMTGRPDELVSLVEDYSRAAGTFREASSREPDYDRVVEVDLASVERSVSGPSKPYNIRRPSTVAASLLMRMKERRSPIPPEVKGLIAMASITSCTNTANPHAMMRAGLVAQAAAQRGLKPPSWVKTSLAPGSLAVSRYLTNAGLLEPLEQLGFHVVGYACASCGGKSGPLKEEVLRLAGDDQPLVAVLSSNRNFDGRIHPLLTASYLCSPGLVIAYALTGTINVDVENDPLGIDASGVPIYLRDLWPSDAMVDEMVRRFVTPDVFRGGGEVASLAEWRNLSAPQGDQFPWDPASTYILEPPFLDRAPGLGGSIQGARVLGIFGDALATDHVSPGGEIPLDSPAGQYLQSLGVTKDDFNTYVGRRGNHEVMARATYANSRIQNRMVPEREGWWTRVWPEGGAATVFEATEAYRERNIPLIVLAGRDFGIGSSRDWAAKGPALLGVRAIIAQSFERIHRSNLIGMGIVPLLFQPGQGVELLALDGSESYTIDDLDIAIGTGHPAHVILDRRDGSRQGFEVRVDVRSDAEASLLSRGGIFQAALERSLATRHAESA
ncbi:aconitate hydratase AcnA [Ancylobacter sp. Lp-2]|uniref:aconitate hydratase AcnA n=1 Tax=Ancylobacter sp. Lp-2 TaxID=2881339 RepID=UPI001E46E6A9|nr:aconitate hydratase AcnA [Ancylobacter sp. Lp-2]MCB4771571.1 aconitate hydratase AcnA [Ancylobacter sp. Lp-2]